jgi:hypothetical protein
MLTYKEKLGIFVSPCGETKSRETVERELNLDSSGKTEEVTA